ncbi:ABC transporter substrate-binding protein [Pelagibacterium halotolerans]|uniref:ABC transporter (Iron.B12.siderophore.hemin), periplasmic substrate-binding component n=1 Tax=Pelagibacterium halotolerans (strain DSM 22347 / JCM 15775 / CGMCC 1.7692 / B2) TaxID=1082931 RepID=G4RGF1_PELHB|nr:ABC transporter substrate-binding protein [Pelagibacterium halotolerans]AEQ50127.1 ABC transporter (iron.B12.siderophore.hemin), periplasmic substrate-binding component [Pelagibacterium halotolerans B2]QJR19859.1 ABC transporter substrate-binding protein [Pelagibacterium halotolerans]SEA48605.1 iron complex transport system substrate-binding protein [Pelagibacterium halotolerans]
MINLHTHRRPGIVGALALMLAASPALAEQTGFPYTDENCGVTTTYEAAPERAVTLSNNATELMLALGLEDRMAGTSYMANLKISPAYADAYAEVPIISPLVATTEELIEAEADFVYAGYPDGFSESRHTRDQLHDLGMKTRLNTEGCNLGPFGFAELFAEIDSVASIFGVADRGEALVDELSTRLDAVAQDLEGVEPISVFIYNGGDTTPNAVLGHTLLSRAVEAAGGENIFADVANRYGQVSWEQIAEREPEYIVVFYSGTASGQIVEDPDTELGQARIDTLKATPAIAEVPAVLNERFILIDSVKGQPGPSTLDAVEAMARAFHPDAFAE